MGRSSRGLTTKIHLSTDNKGRIRQLVLPGGQTADVNMSLDLIQDAKPKKVIADKAYDADWLLHYPDSEAMEAVIPPKKSRLKQSMIDYKAYKERNVIDRTINRLKQHRRIATLYEKTATSFPAMCFLTATFITLFP